MDLDKDNADLTWRRRRRLFLGEVGESRTRGGYLNARTVLVLGLSLVGVIVAFGVAYMMYGHR